MSVFASLHGIFEPLVCSEEPTEGVGGFYGSLLQLHFTHHPVENTVRGILGGTSPELW